MDKTDKLDSIEKEIKEIKSLLESVWDLMLASTLADECQIEQKKEDVGLSQSEIEQLRDWRDSCFKEDCVD